MVTLAVAYAFNVLASQPSWLTGGEDARSFKVPEVLRPGFRLLPDKVLGVAITGKILTYYLVFGIVAVAFLLLLRVVSSPFGRVLQAIRDTPFREEAPGYRSVSSHAPHLHFRPRRDARRRPVRALAALRRPRLRPTSARAHFRSATAGLANSRPIREKLTSLSRRHQRRRFDRPRIGHSERRGFREASSSRSSSTGRPSSIKCLPRRRPKTSSMGRRRPSRRWLGYRASILSTR